MYRVEIEANKANVLPEGFGNVSLYIDQFIQEVDGLRLDLSEIEADLYSFEEANSDIEQVKDAEYSKKDALISVSTAITDYFIAAAIIDQNVEELIVEAKNDFYSGMRMSFRPFSEYDWFLCEEFWAIIGGLLLLFSLCMIVMSAWYAIGGLAAITFIVNQAIKNLPSIIGKRILKKLFWRYLIKPILEDLVRQYLEKALNELVKNVLQKLLVDLMSRGLEDGETDFKEPEVVLSEYYGIAIESFLWGLGDVAAAFLASIAEDNMLENLGGEEKSAKEKYIDAVTSAVESIAIKNFALEVMFDVLNNIYENNENEVSDGIVQGASAFQQFATA